LKPSASLSNVRFVVNQASVRRGELAMGNLVEAPRLVHRLGEARAEVCTARDDPTMRRGGIQPGGDDFA
jgi:hypothetical protein